MHRTSRWITRNRGWATVYIGLAAQLLACSHSHFDSDLGRLGSTQRQAALEVMRNEKCPCGCGMGLRECWRKDPRCLAAHIMAEWVGNQARSGRSANQIEAILRSEGDGFLDKKVVSIALDGDTFRGSPDARVTIVEFADFQCPYCARAEPILRRVLRRFPAEVRLVFKHYPLHRTSMLAVSAALAAGKQGRFWQMHDKLLEHYSSVSGTRVLMWASELKLDMARYQRDFAAAREYEAVVQREVREARSLGVEGTPTLFINGRQFNGPLTEAVVSSAVSSQLNGK